MVVAGAPGDNVFVVLTIGVGDVNEVLFADCQPVTLPVLLPRVSAEAAVPLHSVWSEVTVPPAVTGFTVIVAYPEFWDTQPVPVCNTTAL